MAVDDRLVHGLFGSIVAVLTVPIGLGPAVGGWLAARRTRTARGSVLAGGVAGLVAALPWSGLVYLAAAGAIDPVGYHEGLVHVGVNPAAPKTFVLWQELALAALCGGVILSAALAGGLLGGAWNEVGDELREERSQAG
jgi:hypothetical protein